MKFKVFELNTDEDITDEREWYISPCGNLYFMTYDVSCPIEMASGEFYYKLEIEVF